MIKVRCAKCDKTLNVPDQFAGKKGKCPGCQAMLTIPAAAAGVPAVAPAPPKVRKAAPPVPVEEVEEVEEMEPVEAVEAEEERIADRPANRRSRPLEDEEEERVARQPARKRPGRPRTTMRTHRGRASAENPPANGPSARAAAPRTPPASAGLSGAASSAR